MEENRMTNEEVTAVVEKAAEEITKKSSVNFKKVAAIGSLTGVAVAIGIGIRYAVPAIVKRLKRKKNVEVIEVDGGPDGDGVKGTITIDIPEEKKKK